jgi:colanic acid biosynthesis glycosyl transferase WcaI
MKIQLWSYNYAPEPTGIGPVSATLARALTERGHELHVVAAHPHYPVEIAAKRRRPYRETIDGITVTRLPLWVGRETRNQRIRQEASFAVAQLAALPWLGRCDAVIAVSPCFPALSAAIVNRRIRRRPWVLWLQDILPDAAVSTAMFEDGMTLKSSRRLELAAYDSADRIVVISESFRQNLEAKGVPGEKIDLIYNPATRPILETPRLQPETAAPRILVMGNIGHSQALPEAVRAFESAPALTDLQARLIITGTGVAVRHVSEAITTDRVQMRGLVSDAELLSELDRADLGLVTQRSDFPEFNLPSKLMNYFARGLPVVAAVGANSEAAQLINRSQAGWVATYETFGEVAAAALRDRDELKIRGENGRRFAVAELSADSLAEHFEGVLGRL